MVGVRTPLLRLALSVIALVGSATRLHAHHADAVDATQEMNRCLRLVNVATARRQTLKVLHREPASSRSCFAGPPTANQA